MVGQILTAVRKGLKSSSGHNQPQHKPVKPGDGQVLTKGSIPAQSKIALRRKQS